MSQNEATPHSEETSLEQPSSESDLTEVENQRIEVAIQAFSTMGIDLELVLQGQEQRTSETIGKTPGIGFLFESLVFAGRVSIPEEDEERYEWTVDVNDPKDTYWRDLYSTYPDQQKLAMNELARDEAQYLIGTIGIERKRVVVEYKGENEPDNAYLVVKDTVPNVTIGIIK